MGVTSSPSQTLPSRLDLQEGLVRGGKAHAESLLPFGNLVVSSRSSRQISTSENKIEKSFQLENKIEKSFYHRKYEIKLNLGGTQKSSKIRTLRDRLRSFRNKSVTLHPTQVLKN